MTEKRPALGVTPFEVLGSHDAAPPATAIRSRPANGVDSSSVTVAAHGSIEIPYGAVFHPLAAVLEKIGAQVKGIGVLGKLIQDVVVDP